MKQHKKPHQLANVYKKASHVLSACSLHSLCSPKHNHCEIRQNPIPRHKIGATLPLKVKHEGTQTDWWKSEWSAATMSKLCHTTDHNGPLAINVFVVFLEMSNMIQKVLCVWAYFIKADTAHLHSFLLMVIGNVRSRCWCSKYYRQQMEERFHSNPKIVYEVEHWN